MVYVERKGTINIEEPAMKMEVMFWERQNTGRMSGGIPVNVSRQESSSQNSESRINGGASSRLTQDSQNNLRESAKSVDTSVVVSDFLGTTLGTVSGEQFAPVHLTAFGEVLTADNTNHTEGSGSVRVPRTHEGVTPDGSTKGVASDVYSDSCILNSDSSSPVFFTGKVYDEDLQAYHFLYRNYSPTKGRWTAADPSGFPDGPNQWLYVNNGVMNKVDPLGLMTVVVTGSPESGTIGSNLQLHVDTPAYVESSSPPSGRMITSWSVPENYTGWIVQKVSITYSVYSASNHSLIDNTTINYTEAWSVTNGTVSNNSDTFRAFYIGYSGTYGSITISGNASFYHDYEIGHETPTGWDNAAKGFAGDIQNTYTTPSWWTGEGISHELKVEWF